MNNWPNSKLSLPSLEQIKAEKARRSLREFVEQAWPILEPDTKFVPNWHLDAICAHLTAVTQGKITKLIINIPPGFMKSLSVCVFWPAWEWITKPHMRWLFASYGSHLSIRDSIKTRSLIESHWYQANFGNRYRLVKRIENHLSNDKMGFRFASSIGGVGTGERVHRVVNDDLLNAIDANSDAMREQAVNHLEAMATRGVPSEPFGQVLIMQRLDARDPTSWAQSKGGWEELILPMEFEPNRCARTSIGFVDPRKEAGELLWPALFPKEKVDELKIALGSYKTAAQLQQRPAPEGGGLIKLENLQFYTVLPTDIIFWIQSWDTAFKTGQENDFSVCTTWAVTKTGIYLVDRLKQKLAYPELKKALIRLAADYSPSAIYIEDKASGQSLIQEMQKTTRLPIKPVRPDTDKVSRVHAVIPTMEANAYFPKHAPWWADYLENLLVFPNGAHDDDVDSTSQALIQIAIRRPRKSYGVNIPIFDR